MHYHARHGVVFMEEEYALDYEIMLHGLHSNAIGEETARLAWISIDQACKQVRLLLECL